MYVLGSGTREAIAVSLFVVATTSLVALVQHARAGHVQWRTGAMFGATAMVGAYAGGRLAALVPAPVLLGAFTLMMVATGIAMLRGRSNVSEAKKSASISLVAVEGVVVGLVTGMVGAGGGFLVVPALVLLGGLPMPVAVGTSLLVISMKSFAGFAGHLQHVAISWPVALSVTAAAILGALVGGRVATRVAPARLRTAFAGLVLVMSAVMIVGQLPEAAHRALLVVRWPFWVGGLVLGGFAVLFLLLARKPLGVSTGFSDACAALADSSAPRTWRLPFLVGIALGGVAAALLSGGLNPTLSVAGFDQLFAMSPALKAATFGVGGVLIGFGTRLAGGCTSGHGIVGMAQLARSSAIATVSFMAAGFAVTGVLRTVLGG
jgi:hypothetical protein